MIKALKLFLFAMLIGSVPLFSLLQTSEFEAVIFDCDGVLVDTEYLKFLAWKEALAEENITFAIEEYMPLVGHSSKNILSMLRKLKNLEIPEKVIEKRNSHYRLLQQEGVPPIQEMIDFARRLSKGKEKLGIKLGLASSAPMEEILHNLRQIGLDNAFDLVISGTDDLGSYSDAEGKNKPKPYIYIEAAKRLAIDPSKCLVFEDTNAGVEAAAGAGMIAIGVPNRFTIHQDFSKATQVISSNSQIQEIFK